MTPLQQGALGWASSLYFHKTVGGLFSINAFYVYGFSTNIPNEGKVWRIGDGSASDGITGDFEVAAYGDLGSLLSVTQLNSEIGEAWGGGSNVTITSVVVPEVDEYVLMLTCLILAATVGRQTLRRVFTHN